MEFSDCKNVYFLDDVTQENKQKVGEEVIVLVCLVLELGTLLYETESDRIAVDMSVLTDLLAYFNSADDDEVLRLFVEGRCRCIQLRSYLS